MIMTAICGIHSNMYDPSYLEYIVFAMTRSGDYKRGTDASLNIILLQMSIAHFVDVITDVVDIRDMI